MTQQNYANNENSMMSTSVIRFFVTLLFVGSLFIVSCGDNKAPESRSESISSGHQMRIDSPVLKKASEEKEVVDSTIGEDSESVVDTSEAVAIEGKELSDTVMQEKKEDPVDSTKKEVPVKENDSECGEITEARIKAGSTIFSGKGNCSTCHKGDGTGTPLGPDLTDQTWINVSGDYSSIIENVRNGVQLPIEHPTPMPAMGGGKLTEEELCEVAAYVWSLSHSEH